MRYILFASSDQLAYETIRSCLRGEFRVDVAQSRGACFDPAKKKRYDFVFIDVDFLREPSLVEGYNDYKTALQPFWQEFPNAEIIVMASQEMIREAVMAVKAGASNYVTYPIDPEEIKYVKDAVQKSIRIQSELHYLRDKFWQAESLELIQTQSPTMDKVFDKVQSVAPTKSTVLLVGETGTGKGVLANLIHRHSNRRDKQFISLHCGAIPDTLLESELFGHEKGSFTGAVRRKLGKFEIAHGGTIFLDEVGTITPSAQIKLLQVLQDKTIQRVGGEESIEVDVRIIAATNSDLMKMCEDGLFRTDLYYRLSVFPIEIPPLRERREDIPLLVEVFLRRLNKFSSKAIHGVHPSVMEALERYPWPGNIRELENLIERAYILETSSVLNPESFPSELFPAQSLEGAWDLGIPLTADEVARRGIQGIAQDELAAFLARHDPRRIRAAGSAGEGVGPVWRRPGREANNGGERTSDGGRPGGAPRHHKPTRGGFPPREGRGVPGKAGRREAAARKAAPGREPRPPYDPDRAGASAPRGRAGTASMTLEELRRENVQRLERSYLRRLLASHRGHIGRSASVAGIGIRQLNKLMNKYGFRKEEFKASPPDAFGVHMTLEEVRRRSVEQVEMTYLNDLLTLNKGKIKNSAQAAGIGVRQLNKLMNKYGIRRPRFHEAPEGETKSALHVPITTALGSAGSES